MSAPAPAGRAILAVAAVVVTLAAWRGQATPIPAGATMQAHPYRAFAPLAAHSGQPAPDETRQIIGTSVQGRALEAFSIGSGTRVVVLIGGLHAGSEAPTVDLANELRAYYRDEAAASLPPEVKLVVIPAANPDGLVAGTRTNARDVDLNRNWPADDWQTDAFPASGGTAPLSEPETQALYDYLLDLRPEVVVTYHGYAALVEANEQPPAATWAELYAAAAGYEYIEEWSYYPVTGQLIDAMEEEGIPAFDVELRAQGGASFGENRPAVDALIAAVAASD